jgi:hypothetical protein
MDKVRLWKQNLGNVDFTVGRTFALDGKDLTIGDEVPSRVFEIMNLRALIEKGYVVPSVKLVKTDIPNEAPKPVLGPLSSLSSSDTVKTIRDALTEAGVWSPSSATKAELLTIAKTHTSAEA